MSHLPQISQRLHMSLRWSQTLLIPWALSCGRTFHCCFLECLCYIPSCGWQLLIPWVSAKGPLKTPPLTTWPKVLRIVCSLLYTIILFYSLHSTSYLLTSLVHVEWCHMSLQRALLDHLTVCSKNNSLSCPQASLGPLEILLCKIPPWTDQVWLLDWMVIQSVFEVAKEMVS